jgi:hypothetical protein
MPYNPVSLRNLKSTPRGNSSTVSEVHRVRATAEVQAWFRSLSADQRGALVAEAMSRGAGKAVKGPAAAGVGDGPGLDAAGAAVRPERLVFGAVAGRLQPNHTQLVEVVQAGGSVTGSGRSWTLHDASGALIRAGVNAISVRALVRSGVLVPVGEGRGA